MMQWCKGPPVTRPWHPYSLPRAECKLLLLFVFAVTFPNSESRGKWNISYIFVSAKKCGNRNKSERHVFLIPSPLPTEILSLLSQSISFLTWSTSSVHLKFWGRRLQEFKQLPGPARITKPVPHIRTAAISQVESSILKNEFIYFNLRIITLQYCDGFCHPSTWICHR